MSDKLMNRIQGLLNQANDVGMDTPEGQVFFAKAQELKHKHDIDDIMLRISAENIEAEREKRKTVTDEWFTLVPFNDEFVDSYMEMASILSELCNVRIVFSGDYGDGKFMRTIRAVGYPRDIQYFRMLIVSCQMAFSGRLFPEWDKTKTAGHNIRMLAESGIKWMPIWEAARKAGDPLMRPGRGEDKGQMVEVPAPPNDGGFMKREMGKAYAAEGMEKPKLHHGVQNYRDSFAAAFVLALNNSVRELVMEKRRRESAAGTGVGLVLSSDANAVRDYFHSLYPPGSLRSGGPSRRMKTGYGAAAERGAAAGRSVDLGAGSGGVGGGSGPAGAIR